jgi:hypothetical protein
MQALSMVAYALSSTTRQMVTPTAVLYTTTHSNSHTVRYSLDKLSNKAALFDLALSYEHFL